MSQLASTQVNVNFSIKTDNDFALLIVMFIFWYMKRIAQTIEIYFLDFCEAFYLVLNGKKQWQKQHSQ